MSDATVPYEMFSQMEDRAEAAEARVEKVRALADWFDAQPNWREWRIGSQIRRALAGDGGPTPAERQVADLAGLTIEDVRDVGGVPAEDQPRE